MKKIVRMFTVGVAALAVAAVRAVIGGALLMVMLALIHADLPVVPALGFLASTAVLFAVSLVAGAWQK